MYLTILNIIYYILFGIYIVAVARVVLIILLENRNPTKSLAWIVGLICLPVAGLVLYLFIGRDYRRHKIFPRKGIGKLYVKPRNAIGLDELHQSTLPKNIKKIIRLLMRNNHAVAYENTKIDVLTECEETFEQLFADIAAAKDHIHIEFFILADDDVGNRLRRLLIRKAQEHIRVRLIYDYVGCYNLSNAYLASLRNAGVYVQPFLPVGLRLGLTRINYRSHRKIVVVDGYVGYTGGVNIADRYLTGNRLGSWRDTMVRLEGAAVQGLQNAFLVDWFFVDGKQINAPKYYPTPMQPADNVRNVIQIATSGPDSNHPAILQAIVMAISNATSSVLIQTPYFLPPESVIIALETAAMSGVDVRLMMPEKSDTPLAAAASRSYIGSLLNAGVRVMLYQYNFLHSKNIIVDNNLAIVGSPNMDIRSYEQNFEVAAFIYDHHTVSLLRHAFRNDSTTCRDLSVRQWRRRPRWERLKESLARLFSPLL